MGEMTMSQEFPKISVGRRKFGKALLLLGFCLIPLAALAQTQIYDSKTKKWVNYDKRKARQYFSRNNQVPEAFRRQMVPFRTAEVPGTIIIDGNQHFLYLVQPGGQAIRYGIGVGREGFGWAGIVRVGRRAEWPTWTPPGRNGRTRSECGKMGRRHARRTGQSAGRPSALPLRGR